MSTGRSSSRSVATRGLEPVPVDPPPGDPGRIIREPLHQYGQRGTQQVIANRQVKLARTEGPSPTYRIQRQSAQKAPWAETGKEPWHWTMRGLSAARQRLPPCRDRRHPCPSRMAVRPRSLPERQPATFPSHAKMAYLRAPFLPKWQPGPDSLPKWPNPDSLAPSPTPVALRHQVWQGSCMYRIFTPATGGIDAVAQMWNESTGGR